MPEVGPEGFQEGPWRGKQDAQGLRTVPTYQLLYKSFDILVGGVVIFVKTR